MKLSEAFDLLFTHDKGSANAKVFKTMHEHYNYKNPNSDIKLYLDFVKNNCKEWLFDMPEGWRAKPQLSKPKTAMIKLLQQPKVVEHLGEDYANDLIKIIETTWKQNMHDLVNVRQKANGNVKESEKIDDETNGREEGDNENEELPSDTESENDADDSANSSVQRHINALRRENINLVRRLEKQQLLTEQLQNVLDLHKKLFFEYVKTKEDPAMHPIWATLIENLKL